MTELSQFRAVKDKFFASDPHSPLTPRQKRDFLGLDYYPENPDLRIEIPLEVLPDAELVQIQTSTGDIQVYNRLGKIHYEVTGEPAELMIFENDFGLFLPFVDSMAGI